MGGQELNLYGGSMSQILLIQHSCYVLLPQNRHAGTDRTGLSRAGCMVQGIFNLCLYVRAAFSGALALYSMCHRMNITLFPKLK